MNKTLVILNGPSCVGKSSVVTELGKLQPNLFHLAFDRVKWSFLDYTSGSHTEEIYKLLMLIEEEAIRNEWPLIHEGGLYPKYLQSIIDVAEKAGYRSLCINLTAPKEVLLTRFKQRVEEVTLLNKKIGNTKEDRFWEIYDITEQGKDQSAPTYDTSVMTSEDIAKEIVKLCNKN